MLEQVKAPIWCKLCMVNREEWQADVGMPVCESAPRKLLHHAAVLVLPCAVVCMQVDIPLSKAMMVKEIVNATNHSIGNFITVSGFVC